MVQKANLIIEKFDEGITVRWRDADGNEVPEKSLAPKGREEVLIGELLWDDIFEIIDKTPTDFVSVNIEYKAISVDTIKF